MESKTLELSDTPYPGLRPFRSEETDIFFGRERQTDELLARLAQHRFLAVVGPSGCGKSSLVAAGLMPALATGFMVAAGAHWRVAKLRPGERPLQNLATALLQAGILDEDRVAQPDVQVFLEAALRRGPLGMVEILRGSALAPDANLLVLVDQFEELFRFSAGVSRDDAEAFVALLIASAAAPGARIYLAITMRSDFLGECAPFHGLPEAINDGLYLTPRLTREECAACITGPARVFEAEVEPALVNRLLNDFGPDPDQLPLLQHALLRMWNRHEEERRSTTKTPLGVGDYEAIGGLARSLSNHANEAFGELDPAHQDIARLMFQRLSDSETARRDRRAPAHVQEIAALAGVGIEDVRRVANVFRRRDRCFLVPRDGVELTPETVLDVSHESLLRQWDRAVGWIAEEADTVAAYRRLQEAARGWREGDALLNVASLDRALAWSANATATWALRYGIVDDFRAVCDFIEVSKNARDARHQKRARAARLRRSIVAIALGGLAIAGLIAWVIWPLFYVWEHTSYYAAFDSRYRAPHGLGKLTNNQVRHRPLSFRIVTAGLFGRVLRIDAVNSRDELTEVVPDYRGTERGRHLATSRLVYEYDATDKISSEHQYTRFNELVQGKIYVPLDPDDSRRAVFIGSDGTPIPVGGRSEESTYYWAEKLQHPTTANGDVETISYLGPSGEPVPGQDHAFATCIVYDERGYQISMTSLDASGQPMSNAAGNATMIAKTDEFGNAIESVALDKQGRRTRLLTGWTIRRVSVDEFGGKIEEAYFDKNDEPITIAVGWHKQRLRRDDRGSIIEARYFDQDGKPTTDAELSCYGSRQQQDTMDRLVRWTCIDQAGSPRADRFGVATWTFRYDDRGRRVEESTWNIDGQPASGEDAVATKRYRYDEKGRRTESSYFGTDGKPVISSNGYAKSITSYDAASRTEWVRFFGIDGEPIALKEGYASVKRKRDMWWNITEEHYYDDDGEPVIANDGTAGWRGSFDARGQEIERVLLGKSDEAIIDKDGYASWQAEYDDLGRKTVVHYLDLARQPVADANDGIAGWTAHYDAWGHRVEVTYLGLNGKPSNSIHGEAGWRADYDSRGNQRRVQYFDLKGALTLHAWNDAPFTGQGYAQITYTVDAHSNRVEEAYFGVHEERVARPGSWSYARSAYNDLRQLTRQSYFGPQGEPAKPKGYHTVTWGYDKQGNAMDVRYFDMNETTPVLSNEKIARKVWTYDQERHVVEKTVFGTRGERAAPHNGAHHIVMIWDAHGRMVREEDWGPNTPPNKLTATEFRYDRWGNTIEERHLDANDQPIGTRSERCATETWRFSDRQELVEEGCQGASGTLAPFLANGAAQIAYTYGRPGEKAKEMYYDEHGHPFTTKQGFAGIKYKHDLRGRETEVIYLDARENQVLTSFGHARIVNTYDERGDLVEQAYFLANDSPTTPVAKIESEFDALRRAVKDRYLGPGGKPVSLSGRGQHVTLYDYDNYGNVHALHYLDARGRLTRGYARTFDESWQLCLRWVARYDDNGQRVGNGECQQRLPADEDRANDRTEPSSVTRSTHDDQVRRLMRDAGPTT